MCSATSSADVARRVDLEVVAGHAKALEVAAQPRLEARVDRRPAEAVGGDEHRVPAAGPAEGRRGALHFGAPLGGRRIVGGGDRALLGAERLGRVAPRRVDVFGIDAARPRAWGWCTVVEHARDVADDVGDGLRPDVAGGAVADAVGRLERRVPRDRAAGRARRRRNAAARCRRSRSPRRSAASSRVACEQVAARHPAAGNGLELARQLGDQRQRVVRIAQRATRSPAASPRLAGRNAQLALRDRNPGVTGACASAGRKRAGIRLAFRRRHECAPAAGAMRAQARRAGTVPKSLFAHGLAVIDEHDVAAAPR